MRVQCTSCKEWMQVELEMLGERIQCPHCDRIYFLVSTTLAADEHIKQMKRELTAIRAQLTALQGSAAEGEQLKAKVVNLEGALDQKKDVEQKTVGLQAERDLFKQTAEALERAQLKAYEKRLQQERERDQALETARVESARLRKQLTEAEENLERIRGAGGPEAISALRNRMVELEQRAKSSRELADELKYAQAEMKSAQREIKTLNERIATLEFASVDRNEVAERLVAVTQEKDRLVEENEKLKRRLAEIEGLGVRG
jgi:chromosome segregation ATPase